MLYFISVKTVNHLYGICCTVLMMDWVLSHWVHFTVDSLDFVVFICVYFVLFFILHICCVIVITVGWT